jgi:uncharacterized protein (DUF2267 family)
VKYIQFIEKVAEAAGGLSLGRAEAITLATLRTLAERITGTEARDLTAQLPSELKDPLAVNVTERAEYFDLDEFARRVADRADIDLDQAYSGVRAVFATLRGAVSHGEFDDVLAQLPNEFQLLLEPAAGPW